MSRQAKNQILRRPGSCVVAALVAATACSSGASLRAVGTFSEPAGLSAIYKSHRRPLVVIDGQVYVVPGECAAIDTTARLYGASERAATSAGNLSSDAKPTVHAGSATNGQPDTDAGSASRAPTVHGGSTAPREPKVYGGSNAASPPTVHGGPTSKETSADANVTGPGYECTRLGSTGFRVSGLDGRVMGVYLYGVWLPEVKDGVVDDAVLIRATHQHGR